MQDFDEILNKYSEIERNIEHFHVPKDVYVTYYDIDNRLARLSDGRTVDYHVLLQYDPYRFKCLKPGCQRPLDTGVIAADAIKPTTIQAQHIHTNHITVSGVTAYPMIWHQDLSTGDRMFHDDRLITYEDAFKYDTFIPQETNPEARAYHNDRYNPNDRMYADPNVVAPPMTSILYGADPGPPLSEKIRAFVEPIAKSAVATSRTVGHYGAIQWEEHWPEIQSFSIKYKNAIAIAVVVLCFLFILATLI